MDMTAFNTSVLQALRDVGDFFAAGLDWMVSFLDSIVSKPILFIFVVAVPLVGLGIGLLNRVIRAN